MHLHPRVLLPSGTAAPGQQNRAAAVKFHGAFLAASVGDYRDCLGAPRNADYFLKTAHGRREIAVKTKEDK